MNKIRINSHRSCILIAIFTFLVACYAADIKERLQENLTDSFKFDVTRIVNKVLDSTDIARLYGFDADGRFAIFKNDFIKNVSIRRSTCISTYM